MYATIEPRLIALLNDEPSESFSAPPSLELPPLHDPNILKASGRPLLLEPDTSKRSSKATSSTQLVPQHTTLISSSTDDDGSHKNNQAKNTTKESNSTDRALGSTSPQSLRKILDGGSGNTSSLSSKKRRIVEASKDDFVQLPQPPKKQKAAKQVVPPIIIGLFEPPPNAALFPPIASSAFHDSHGRNSLNIVPPKEKSKGGSSSENPLSTVEKRKSRAKEPPKKEVRAARKKWTEEETNQLLLGVHRHGVGKWTDILDDPDFVFNARTGVDLKDRFRTCCPIELREKSPKPRIVAQSIEYSSRKGPIHVKSKSSLMSENILIGEDQFSVDAGMTLDESSIAPLNTTRKSRAHRRKLEDLAQLGIEGPFKKSQRRERKPFSDDDDREILEGYNLYGPAWTRIQKDSRFHLQKRQPTDLRDRFRNKYPEKFRPAEDKRLRDMQTVEGRGKENLATDSGPSYSILQPSSHEQTRAQQTIPSEHEKHTSKALPLQSQISLYGFKDNFLQLSEQSGAVESADTLPFSQSFDWNEGITAPFSGSMGEMDISRLLLDESWTDASGFNGKQKQSYTDINSICTSSADPLPQGPPFYSIMSLDTEQIVNMSSSAVLDHDATFG
jgi:hypothetical protein